VSGTNWRDEQAEQVGGTGSWQQHFALSSFFVDVKLFVGHALRSLHFNILIPATSLIGVTRGLSLGVLLPEGEEDNYVLISFNYFLQMGSSSRW